MSHIPRDPYRPGPVTTPAAKAAPPDRPLYVVLVGSIGQLIRDDVVAESDLGGPEAIARLVDLDAIRVVREPARPA